MILLSTRDHEPSGFLKEADAGSNVFQKKAHTFSYMHSVMSYKKRKAIKNMYFLCIFFELILDR